MESHIENTHDICEEIRRRVDKLEERINNVTEKMETKLGNIEIRVERIDSRVALGIWAGGIAGTAVIVALVGAVLRVINL